MKNPYHIEGPAIVSFSGGRTSGFMLHQIIDAHGGMLPDDVVVCFANTGLEHEATLEFVSACALHWQVPIVWLEYRPTKPQYVVVDFASASRKGEPFEMMIAKRGFTPNPVARMCTQELKVRLFRDYAQTAPDPWETWDNVVGLRADEPGRVAKGSVPNREAWTTVHPIARAGHTLADVRAFWSVQPFDLALPFDDNAYGNCVGCFLKAQHKLERIALDNPAHLEWWAKQEEKTGSTFRCDRPSYRGILTQVSIQGRLFAPPSDDTIPCMCTE